MTRPTSRPIFLQHRTRAVAALMMVALALGGCADRPIAASFITKPQKKMASAAHWNIVAKDVASAVSAYLERQTGKKEPVQVYMMRDGDTLFADAFQQSLITAFVQEGHPVAVDARPDAVSVGIDLALVPHSADRANRSVPGPLTALGSGVGVGAYLLDTFPWGVTSTYVGLALDAVRATVGETNAELVMTVSLAKDGFFTFRSSAVYYVQTDEVWQYQEMPLNSFNDVPQNAIGYDLGHQPYLKREPRGRRS
jgi:hypothetical protein